MNCEAGWTRSGENGARVIVCLLDREPVLNTYDRLRPLRTQGGGAASLRSDGEAHHEEIAPSSSLATKSQSVKGYYAARIAALSRHAVPGGTDRRHPGDQERKDTNDPRRHRRWSAYFQNEKTKPRENIRNAFPIRVRCFACPQFGRADRDGNRRSCASFKVKQFRYYKSVTIVT